MKITFKSLFIAFLLVAGYTNAYTQRGGGWGMDPEKRAEKQTAVMKDSLSLSDAQATKVGEVLLKYAKQMLEVRDSNSESDWPAMRERIIAIREEQNKELKTVLTTEQYDKWTKILEERRNQRGQRGRNGNRDNRSNDKNK